MLLKKGIPSEEEAYNFFVGKETADKEDKKETEDTEQEAEVIIFASLCLPLLPVHVH